MQYVREAPGNIASEKILCNFSLILLGQHCPGQNPSQSCTEDSRQHCIRKYPVQFYLNTPVATLHKSNTYAMLSELLQTTSHKKNLVPNCLNTLSTTLHMSKPSAMLSERLQTIFYKKKSCSMFA